MGSDYKFTFEKLNVWHEGRELTNEIYKDSQQFPANERFGLTSQIRRAAISICSNIAEGSSRTSNKDQAYFYQIAYSSLMEFLNQIIIAKDLNYLSLEQEDHYRKKVSSISNKLNSLRKSRLNK